MKYVFEHHVVDNKKYDFTSLQKCSDLIVFSEYRFMLPTETIKKLKLLGYRKIRTRRTNGDGMSVIASLDRTKTQHEFNLLQ